MRLPIIQIKNHLTEQAIRPREPTLEVSNYTLNNLPIQQS